MKLREMKDIAKLDDMIKKMSSKMGYSTDHDIIYRSLCEKRDQKIREYGSNYSNDKDLYDFIIKETKNKTRNESIIVEPNSDRYVQLAKEVRIAYMLSAGCLVAFIIMLLFG